jgi:hypothetical protein
MGESILMKSNIGNSGAEMPRRINRIQSHRFNDCFAWRPACFSGRILVVKKKVKCTLVQALRLCTSRTAHRGSRYIALLFHDHGTRRVWRVSVTPRPIFNSGKDPVPIAQEAGWAPGPVWTGAENLALTGIRSPDRPARNHSLYQLRYPAHNFGWLPF